jgi:folate-binding protein YgfZ
MRLTALQSRADGLGATGVGEYRGATTALRFGDAPTELAALLTACGVYDLGFRAKISVSGSDRVRWLNGMVTNNVRDLAVDQGVYAFLLNPVGHILGDLYAYNRGESIVVDTDRNQVEKILETFDHYIIMDDVEIKNLSEEITAIGISGPQSREILAKVGFRLPQLQALRPHTIQCQCDCGCQTCTIVRSDAPGAESYEIWLAPAEARSLWDSLVKAEATRVGSEALEMQRILSGIPRYGVDIRERDLPQETEQARALNFNKGCYVGQEIVERIRSRGAVHRKFSGFVAESAVTAGSKIAAGEKEVGEVTSATSVKLTNHATNVALGYIRREVSAPGREVKIGTIPAQVAAVPIFEKLFIEQERPLEQKQRPA